MNELLSLVLAGLISSWSASATSGHPISISLSTDSKAPAVASTMQEAEVTERFEQSYPLSVNGRVSVSNVNGSIVIEAWDKNEVKVDALKIADSQERLADIQIKVEASPSFVKIESDFDARKRHHGIWVNSGKQEVQMRIFVPRTAVLDEIEMVNGPVTVSNTTNKTRVSVVNGSLRATNLRGTAILSSVNGTVEADFEQVDPASRISLDTVNGKVFLVLPSNIDATVKAESLNGIITNDFGLTVRKGQYVGRDLHGKLGSGQSKITLESVNGGLVIQRKQDGKPLNPATNLLKDENDDDNPDEDDEDGIVSAKTAKEITQTAGILATEAVKTAVTATVDKVADGVADKIAAEIDAKAKSRAAAIAQAQAVQKVNLKELKAAQEKVVEKQKQMADKYRQQAEAYAYDYAYSFGSPLSIETKQGTFKVKGVPRISVDVQNCDVVVRGWDKQEVSYVLSRRQNGAANPDTFNANNNGDSDVAFTLNTNGSHSWSNEGPTRNRLEIFVPKRSNLKISTDREIRLEGVSGELDVRGQDESVNIIDSDGSLKVASGDGRVRVLGFNGDLDAETGDGTVFLEGEFSKITANAGDGTFVLSMPSDANATIRTNIDELSTEDLDLEKVSDNEWRIGDGRARYDFNVAEGQVIVRCANLIKQ